MRIKYTYNDEVENSLALLNLAISDRKDDITNKLEDEMSPDHHMFNKYLRSDINNDHIIRSLREKERIIIQNALPVKVEILSNT